MRLLFITDFTEQFAYRFLRGILNYSQSTGQWVVCKMPPAYKRQLGIEGVVSWAKDVCVCKSNCFYSVGYAHFAKKSNQYA